MVAKSRVTLPNQGATMTAKNQTATMTFASKRLVMDGAVQEELLVNNIMPRLDYTTKEVIRKTATISKQWENLWTQLPRLTFSYKDDGIGYVDKETDLHAYISFIDNTLKKCSTNLNLKNFKLEIYYSSLVNAEFKSLANTWIRYAISRNVEEVDLELFDRIGGPFSYDDDLFFNNLCFNRVKLSSCVLNPPNGKISWQRLKCLWLSGVTLDEDMIEKILSGSPRLESLELYSCYGYRRIDIVSKSVKKLVFSGYTADDGIDPYEEGYIDCVKIYAPYISSLTIKGELYLRELVLLKVSSLVEAHLDYSISWSEYEIFKVEVLRELLKSLDHVEDITYGAECFEILSCLETGSDTSDDDRV